MNSNIYTVSSLNLKIKNSLESGFSNIGVEGEVSNFYCHNNRHLYFDLKDDNSKIKVVMFYEAKKSLASKLRMGCTFCFPDIFQSMKKEATIS